MLTRDKVLGVEGVAGIRLNRGMVEDFSSSASGSVSLSYATDLFRRRLRRNNKSPASNMRSMLTLTVDAIIAHLLSHVPVVDWPTSVDVEVGTAPLALCSPVD